MLGLIFPSTTKDISWLITEPAGGIVGGATGYMIGYFIGYAFGRYIIETKDALTSGRKMGDPTGGMGSVIGATYGIWWMGTLIEKDESSIPITFIGALLGGLAGYITISSLKEDLRTYSYAIWGGSMLGGMIAFRLALKKS